MTLCFLLWIHFRSILEQQIRDGGLNVKSTYLVTNERIIFAAKHKKVKELYWPTSLPPPLLTLMVWSYVLLRVAAGVDHHIWCSAWGRLVSCHVPAIPRRYASASPQRFGVFSFAFANEILFAWVSAGSRSLEITLNPGGGWNIIYLTLTNQSHRGGVGGTLWDGASQRDRRTICLNLMLRFLCTNCVNTWVCPIDLK